MLTYRQILISILLSLTIYSCQETVESTSYLQGYYEINRIDYSEEVVRVGQSDYIFVHLIPDSIVVVATLFDKETLSDFFYSVYPMQNGYGVRPYYPVDKYVKDVNDEDLLLAGGGLPLSNSYFYI